MIDQGLNLQSTPSVAAMLKEKACYVALDYAEEMKKDPKDLAITVPFEILNRQGKLEKREVTMTTERFECMEILFNPSVSLHF